MASIAFIISAYLIGSMPQVYWLIRLKGSDIHGNDLHEHLWSLSHKLGTIGFIIDLAKGAVVILLGRWFNFPVETIAMAGLLVVVGQMWPVYLLRSGGGGNSAASTVALTLAVYPFLIALIPVLIGLSWRIVTHIKKGQHPLGHPHSKSMPIGVFTALATLPLSSWLLSEPIAITLSFLGLFVTIIGRRLIKGLTEESRVNPLTAKIVLKHFILD